MKLETIGQGENVLFVHGLGGTPNVFWPQVSVLSRFFKCLCPELPGSGSSPAATPFTLVDLADQLAALLQSEGGRAHVVGHSLGTVVCQHLAARHGDLVRSLALIGPLREPAPGARSALADRAVKARAEGMSGIADAIVAGGTSAETKAHQPVVAAFVRELLMRQDPEGYALTCEALSKAEAADGNAITVPTLLITGDEDGTAPPPAVLALQQTIAGARTVILDRCGHWTTLERPSEVNSALLNFLLT